MDISYLNIYSNLESLKGMKMRVRVSVVATQAYSGLKLINMCYTVDVIRQIFMSYVLEGETSAFLNIIVFSVEEL